MAGVRGEADMVIGPLSLGQRSGLLHSLPDPEQLGFTGSPCVFVK